MTTFVRGETVNFSAPCFDASGQPMAPSSASLNLVYVSIAGVRTKSSLSMTIADNVVSVNWDSSVAASGVVYWNIKAMSGQTVIEQDGTVVLTSNQANSG